MKIFTALMATIGSMASLFGLSYALFGADAFTFDAVRVIAASYFSVWLGIKFYKE
jgi:hypothetical protein